MYCRTCKYDLHRIDSPACPECGRPFTASDPRTWDPVPSRPKTSLGILVGAFVLLVSVQLILGLVRPLLPTAVASLDWLLPALAPLGAFASGWYAERRPALLLYGGLCIFVVAPAFHTHGFGAAFTMYAHPLVQGALWIGTALALMFGCWLIGRFAWSTHGRIERRRWEMAARGEHEQRRRGPRPRTIVVLALLSFVMIVAWMVTGTLHVMYGVAGTSTDYDAEIEALRFEAAGMERDEKESVEAWTDFVTALAQVRQTYRLIAREAITAGYEPRYDTDRGGVHFDYVLQEDTLPPDIERERRAVATFLETGIFGAIPPMGPRPLAIGAPWSDSSIWMAYMAAPVRLASMRLAADRGDHDEAAGAFEEMLALAQAAAYRGPSLEAGMAAHLHRVTMRELRHELVEYDFPEPVCADLLDLMDRITRVPAELILECERSRLRDAIQLQFTEDATGDGYRLVTAAAGTSWLERFLEAFDGRFRYATRREESARCEAAIDAALVDLALPHHERRQDAEDDVPPEIEDRFVQAADAMRTAGNVLLVEAFDRQEIETARIAIALAIFRARDGEYPATLDALVPGILSDLPPDPMTGTSFGYRRLTGDPHGRPYILYSFGRNGVDDGGTFGPDQARTSGPKTAGPDKLLTPPRFQRPSPP